MFYGNRVEDCWHGLWGGYSFDSWIAANHFARNTEAIAIEHGQDNRITENRFDGDETAIRLWKNTTQDPDWGYPEAARHAQPRLRHLGQHLPRQFDCAEDHRDAKRARR